MPVFQSEMVKKETHGTDGCLLLLSWGQIMVGLDGCQGSLYYAVSIISYRINRHHKDSLSFFPASISVSSEKQKLTHI